MSACESPLAAKSAVSWSRLNDGGASLPVTLLAVELSPSSRPSSTVYDGPPACANKLLFDMRKEGIVNYGAIALVG